MAKLCLPLWFVTERGEKRPPRHTPCDDLGATVTFTASEGLAAFLNAGRAGKWKVVLVTTFPELMLAVGDIHASGASAICIDPGVDGSGGEHVALDHVVAQLAAA